MTKVFNISAFVATAIVALFAFSTAYAAKAPTCTITVEPAVVSGAQSATLKWTSTEGALFAEIDNGIGSVAADGQMVISPDASTVYTLHVWNSVGEGSYCSTALTVGQGTTNNGSTTQTQPTVTVETVAVHNASNEVVLANVPYTGPVEDAAYVMFLLSVVLTAGYVFTAHRKTVFA